MLDPSTHTSDRITSEQEKIHIAYFITPHGFGHAARAAAIMAAVHDLDQSVYFEIYTLVPSWFFQDSLGHFFTVHSLKTDIGLVQKSPLEEDLPATLQSLAEFIPFDPALLSDLADQLKKLKCQIVLCDIAPLGIAIAHKAGLRSVLIENFTWDWIYQGYLHEYTKFGTIIDYLNEIFISANFHIQTEPICAPDSHVDLTTQPVSRNNRLSIHEVRDTLSIPEDSKAVLITMGGFETAYDFMTRLHKASDYYFIIPGTGSSFEMEDNLIFLPHHSNFYHPDLVNASDAVVGKTGYSTVSEVFHAGLPFGFVSRSKFRESHSMAVFIRKRMHGFEISEPDFSAGIWVSKLPELFSHKRVQRNVINGSYQAARFILDILEHH